MREAATFAVSRLFEMPTEAFPGGWSLTITDGVGAYLSGCEEILSYSDTSIDVKTVGDGAVLEISGEGLDIVRYSGADISIRGVILSAVISSKERNGEKI